MKRLSVAALSAGLILLQTSLYADDAQKRKWEDKAEVSVVSTNGNSKATTTSVKNFFAYRWSDVTGLEIDAAGLGSRSGSGVTAENYKASEKVTWKLVGRNYLFERFGWDKDRFAGIRDRYDSSVGVGRLVIDGPKDKLNAELGGGFISEKRTDDTSRDFGSGRAFTKYEHALSASSSFMQSAEYIHNFEQAKAYRLNTETALIAALNTRLSLKSAFEWKRNGQPPPGAVKDDTIVSMALVVNF
jgi:putative salt-induced outer membrane protein